MKIWCRADYDWSTTSARRMKTPNEIRILAQEFKKIIYSYDLFTSGPKFCFGILLTKKPWAKNRGLKWIKSHTRRSKISASRPFACIIINLFFFLFFLRITRANKPSTGVSQSSPTDRVYFSCVLAHKTTVMLNHGHQLLHPCSPVFPVAVLVLRHW